MTRIPGQLTTADYLPPAELKKLFEGLRRDKLYNWEVYCKISYCTALRISDIRTTTWKDILHQREIVKREQKTKKTRLITFNQEVIDNVSEMYRLINPPDLSVPLIPYTREYINRRLKHFRVRYQLQIRRFSTHTFRKSFARNMFEANGANMKALSLIQKILNHNNPNTTLAYMGYVQDDIISIYQALHF